MQSKFDAIADNMTETLQILVYGTVGLFGLIAVVYVLARVASLGYFRSKDAYDRSVLEEYFRRKRD